MKYFSGISLFSNCGAGDYGFRKAGFRFEVMAELLPERLEVCALNHPEATLVQGDLEETWPSVLESWSAKKIEHLDLLAACPPCQGMSSARALRGLACDADAGSKDPRNLLAVVVAKVAMALNPTFIVVENVPDFFARKIRHPQTQNPTTAASLLTELLEKDYKPFPVIADLSIFGIPQTRKRAFLTFVRRTTNAHDLLLKNGWIPYPYPTAKAAPISLRNYLEKFKLPRLDSSNSQSEDSRVAKSLHFVPALSPERLRMVSAIPPHSGKSAWQNNTCPDCGQSGHSNGEIVCRSCGVLLPKPIVETPEGTKRLIKGFKTSYKRMASDRPAATITTATSSIACHNTIHPWENRVLSPWECALLQTFDDDFIWGDSLKKYGHTNIRAMIGEAVPPLFTYLQGEVLLGLLDGRKRMPTPSDVYLPEYQKGMQRLFEY